MTRYPVQVCLLWALTLAVAAIGLTRLQVSTDTRAFFDSTHPGRVALRNFEARYQESNTAFVAMTLPRGSTIADSSVQQALAAFARECWSLPRILRVDALSNYQQVIAADEAFEIRALFSSDGTDPIVATQETVKELLARDSTILGRLASEDLRTFGINLTFALPEDTTSGSQVIKDINLAIDKLRGRFKARHPEFEIHVTGMVRLIDTFGKATIHDLKGLIPLSVNVAGLMLLILLRKLSLALPVLIVSSCAAAVTTALWAHLDLPLNVATVVGPVIVLSLTLAAALHLLIAVRAARCQGEALAAAIHSGIQATRAPSLLAWTTTTVGFLSFNGADAPPFRELGNFVALGVAIGYLMIYTLMPALCRLFGVPYHPAPKWVKALAQFVVRKQSALFLICLSSSALLALGVTRIELDDRFSEYFDDTFEYRQASAIVEQRITGLEQIELDLPHPNGDGVEDPQYVHAIRTLTEWLREQPGVVNVAGVFDIVTQVHLALHPEQTPLPQDQSLLGEYLFLYELALPPGKELSNLISVDRTATRISVTTRGLSSAELRHLGKRIEHAARELTFFEQVSVSGLSMLYAGLSIENVKSMLAATAGSIVIMALIVSLVLRQARFGLACLVVTIIPLVAGFGWWGWVYQVLGLPGAVIVALTIGIIVDDAIHFIHKYRARSHGNDQHDLAVSHAVESAGQAMVLTTICLSCGFALLTFSGFQINQHVGLFTCLIVLLALAFDLMVLPKLLAILHRSEPRAQQRRLNS